jgi:serine phosphatase RsbU (regulator of sigma subunit)/DNA-binding GntR family transcriptional regulator
MTRSSCEELSVFTTNGNRDQHMSGEERIRSSPDFQDGRYDSEETLMGWPAGARQSANRCDLDFDSALPAFADLGSPGMVTRTHPNSALVRSPHPKEMELASKVRRALEEIGGLEAAPRFMGNSAELERELDAMQVAISDLDVDSCQAQGVRCHPAILPASGSDPLLGIRESRGLDIRIRAGIGRMIAKLAGMMDSYRPIAVPLEKGHGRQAGLWLRDCVDVFMRLLKKTEVESASLKRDLETAEEVQKAFIPQNPPTIPGLTCETFYRPAYCVGGDYYDFLPLKNGHWGIAIGDVSGKGIGAALMMASLHAAVRAQAHHRDSDPTTLIRQVNRLVHQSSPPHFYAALVYAEYDSSTRLLEYINAGHNPPFVVRCGEHGSQVFQLNHGGAPLGIFADSRHHATPFQLKSGDIIVACTDGVTEAENPDGEGWGQQRLENLFSSCGRRTARQVLEDIVNEVSNFVGEAPPIDDMTVVVIEVQPEGVVHKASRTKTTACADPFNRGDRA